MTDSKNNDLWPVAKFFFLVSFKGKDFQGDIRFKEVSGLDQETDVIEYRHGDTPSFSTIKKPGLVKNTNVTCKKGVMYNDDLSVEFLIAITQDKKYYAKADERLTVTIKLQDEQGAPIMSWELYRAYLTNISGTDLKSDANEIAIEILELAHEGLTTTVIT